MKINRLAIATLAALLPILMGVMPASAQEVRQEARPAGLQPLPEPPPPPAGYQLDPALEPQVTITNRGADKAEEYRVSGRLYMIKVTQPNGLTYYLIDSKGDGTFSKQESFDSGMRVPQWVIGTF